MQLGTSTPVKECLAQNPAETLKRRIIGFHQDDHGDWVAELECGHGYHIRHDPPWQDRAWVLTAEGRAARMGVMVNCIRCDMDDKPE